MRLSKNVTMQILSEAYTKNVPSFKLDNFFQHIHGQFFNYFCMINSNVCKYIYKTDCKPIWVC